MEHLTAGLWFIVAALGALLLNVLSNDLYDRCPRVAVWLLDRAVSRVRDDQKDRYREEWAAHLLFDCPTKLDQVRLAVGLWWKAGVIAKQGRAPVKRKYRLDFIITASVLVAVGLTVEGVGSALGGAPWWYLITYVPSVGASIFVVILGLRIRKKDGNIIEIPHSR
jgi:hypothetical protein